MKSTLLLIVSLITFSAVQCQNKLTVVVKSQESKQPLSGASVTIPSLHQGKATDSTGTATIDNLPNGQLVLEVSYVGYNSTKRTITLPRATKFLVIELQAKEEGDEVIVTTTRMERSVGNTPTRVEVIGGGEISENISMRPGEIRMLLNETTGIITQQTSAVSNTANLRIQELEGRYTQILRDGFPLYSGLSEGLSLVQIAPLDLKQVEIIKGSSSTLYGGGAIAGLINLVSKTPGEKRELSFLANGTSTKGLDLSGFYSEKYGKIGLTVFTSRNSSGAYDPAGTGFSAIPKFHRYTVTPRLFYYGEKTNINAGISHITEDRLGGNMSYIEHATLGYFEHNNSDRFTAQLALTQKFGEHSSFSLKNSYNHFNRSITIPNYQFKGLQQSSFSEVSWNRSAALSSWVIGTNVYTDNFRETAQTARPLRNYSYTTGGAFIQNTWSPSSFTTLETGLRGDYTAPYGFVLLPRMSVLFHLSHQFDSRVGGGFGYKLPTIFTEESEERQYRNILPLNEQQTGYERSVGGSFDFTYRATFNKVRVTVNPLLFYTRINHPLIFQTDTTGISWFKNANGYTDSKGLDLSLRLALSHFSFFTGYSYTIADNHFGGAKSSYPLAPHDRLHFDLVYSVENKLRVAFESYYTGSQQLSNGETGKPYWLIGALVEKTWNHFSIFINSENLNNVRQSQWGPVYTGSISNPTFKDIYAPLEGRSINAGVKVNL
jgi:iron complex outermembrane receptor protein